MPENVKDVVSTASRVDKNKNGYWETYYQDGIVMVYIPPGEFMMGQTREEKEWLIDQVGEKDYYLYDYDKKAHLHKVDLKGYWMGKTPVTIKQYMQFVNETKSHYPVWLEEGNKYNINTGNDNLYKEFGTALTGDDPPGPECGIYRVMRGGNWISQAMYLRCAARINTCPSDPLNVLGFRLCQDI